MSRILVVEPIHPDGLAILRDHGTAEVIAFDAPATDAQLRDTLPDTIAILVRTLPLGADFLALAPNLEIVSKHGVGCDNIDVAHCSRRSIPVAIAAGANATSVAEHTLMLMLACAKRLPAQDAAARAGDWAFRKQTEAFELKGKTVLIIGMGRIGSLVSPLCAAFGMRVIGYDPHATFDGVARADNLDTALGQADIVTIHTPMQPETQGMIGAAQLARMKPDGIFINCARGGVADEPALIDALKSGHLAMLGTDVFVTEPMLANDPLLALPNVIATPHTAAMTAESARAMATVSAQNILDHLDARLDPGVIFNEAELADNQGEDR